MNRQNIVLTGIPRSGSTLVCHLLNKLPQTVALHEPMTPVQKNENVLREVENFFSMTRGSLLEKGCALSKHANGKVPDNNFKNQFSASGERLVALNQGVSEIQFEKTLNDNFQLCIKQNAFFTSVLNTLANHFSCYAIIRNPIAVLGSWNSVNLPVSNGHIPAAERLDIQLKKDLESMESVLARQLHILDWFFQQYSRYIEPKNIIRYEQIVSTSGRCLSVIDQSAAAFKEQIKSKNNSELYAQKQREVYAEALLKNPNHGCWKYYQAIDMESLL